LGDEYAHPAASKHVSRLIIIIQYRQSDTLETQLRRSAQHWNPWILLVRKCSYTQKIRKYSNSNIRKNKFIAKKSL
jgi:hypothetical protein